MVKFADELHLFQGKLPWSGIGQRDILTFSNGETSVRLLSINIWNTHICTYNYIYMYVYIYRVFIYLILSYLWYFHLFHHIFSWIRTSSWVFHGQLTFNMGRVLGNPSVCWPKWIWVWEHLQDISDGNIYDIQNIMVLWM